jgi:hypothetical protein
MDAQSACQLAFDFGRSKAVVIEPSAAQVSSDAGLLPFRQLDERLGMTEQFAACLTDERHAGSIDHTFLEMVRMRTYGILASVRIHIRGDSGFGVPAMYEACERLDVAYTFGIGMNARLKKYSDSLLETAVTRYGASGQPQRLFCAFWYRADTWPAQRWVVVKCEARAQGTNRRAIVTNRPGAFVLPAAVYDAYA